MKHTLSVLVENKPGVLTRVAGLFARRGFNIDSLVVAETENPAVSRMTITVDEQDHPVEQVTKQLHKLINVLKITDLDPAGSVERELLLIKVKADAQSRSEIMQIVEIFRAKIVDVSSEVLIIEMTGTREKVSAFMELLAALRGGGVDAHRAHRDEPRQDGRPRAARARCKARPVVLPCHDAPKQEVAEQRCCTTKMPIWVSSRGRP